MSKAMLHLGNTYDLVDLEGCGHAFECLVPKRLAGEIVLDEPLRHRADDDGIGCGQPLEAGCNIGRLSQGQLLLPPATTHLPHHDEPCVDAHTDRQADPRTLGQATIEGVHGLNHAQSGAHGALCIVFMCLGVAKVDE
jgi:hypothetical protein